MRARRVAVTVAVLASGLLACGRNSAAPVSSNAGPDQQFDRLAEQVIADDLRHSPSTATDLGIHTYDAELPDLSRAGIEAQLQSLRQWRARVDAVNAAPLSVGRQIDREQLRHALDSEILSLDTIRSWAKDPDTYSSGVTRAAYVIIKRDFAPAADRLRTLIAREQKMPGMLAQARKNLDNPPRIYTEIALEQIDGDISFFTNDVTTAFAGVQDAALLNDFRQANAAVVAALEDYKTFVKADVLPRSNGSFAIGADTYRKALEANEMVTVPLDQLLAIAEMDRQHNEEAFQATARAIDAKKTPEAVLASLQTDHPSPGALLKTTQDTLDSLRQFIIDHGVITIPPSPPATVKETPPFMRSTTSASMDTPGPFERAPLKAFYNMTLPDPRWPAAEQADFMRQWYLAAIANVSVHEVYPGHYLQFLYAKSYPSDVRKVYSASTNSEGWAHYCEQMMMEQGFHSDDPRYHLAQLQDALLRDVRFIVGIRMHTQGMTVDEATRLFETEGHQPHPVAVSEAKRGTGDPLYGYYTMGKLMILKLRADYQAKLGAAFSLKRFHDDFIRLGPLPLPLVRRALLGQDGAVF